MVQATIIEESLVKNTKEDVIKFIEKVRGILET